MLVASCNIEGLFRETLLVTLVVVVAEEEEEGLFLVIRGPDRDYEVPYL